jgi:hypothetical protein
MSTRSIIARATGEGAFKGVYPIGFLEGPDFSA